MIAAELNSKILDPLKTSDTGEEALTKMNLYHVKHLPIVNDTQLLGIISESDVLNNDLGEPIGSFHLSLADSYVHKNEHIFEVMGKLAKSNLTVISVIDDKEDYIGMITMEDLIQYYANSFSFKEPGSIVVLETTKSNYSLNEISRIVEEESAAVLSSFITSSEKSMNVYVTIKINKQDISRIVASFERYEYGIKASYSKEEFIDSLQGRYDSLMKYLSV